MENDLRRYVRVMWHWAWLIALGVVLAGGLAYVASRLTTPVFQASVKLLISEAPGSGVANDYASILTSERLAETYANMLADRPVMEVVAAKLQLNTTPNALAGRVTVNVVPNTQLLELSVENEDPALAAQIANLIPAVFRDQNAAAQASRYADTKANLTGLIDSLKTQIDQKQAAIDAFDKSTGAAAQLSQMQSELAQLHQSYIGLQQSLENVRLAEAQSTSNILVVTPAEVPTLPIRPRITTNTLLGSIAGLILAVGLIFLIEYLDDRLRSPDQVSQILGLPTIGLIAKWNTAGNGDSQLEKLIAVREPRSPIVEAFRSLRSNIQFSAVDRPIQTLLLTSSGPVEGKSTIAANLAVVMAHIGKRVILIDADLRRPTVHKTFGLRNDIGLTSVMVQDGRLETALQGTPIENLRVITSGPLPPNPSELLGSKRMSLLVEELRGMVDTIIIDSPPVMAVTDALILSALADGVLMIVDAGSTRIGAARQVKQSLDQASAHVIGVVMNKIPAGRRGGYYYYYQYEYHYYHYKEDRENGHHGNSNGKKRNTLRSVFQSRGNNTSSTSDTEPKTESAVKVANND